MRQGTRGIENQQHPRASAIAELQGRNGDKMGIADKVQEIALKVRTQKATIATEEATKNAFVMPFISTVLGYDVFNPSEVIPEFVADVGIKKGEKLTTLLCATAMCRSW
jgi:hypothetical protein